MCAAAAWLLASLPTACFAVDQATALATVVSTFVNGHPEEDYLEIYSPSAPLAAGTTLDTPGYVGGGSVPDPTTSTWFFWIVRIE